MKTDASPRNRASKKKRKEHYKKVMQFPEEMRAAADLIYSIPDMKENTAVETIMFNMNYTGEPIIPIDKEWVRNLAEEYIKEWKERREEKEG